MAVAGARNIHSLFGTWVTMLVHVDDRQSRGERCGICTTIQANGALNEFKKTVLETTH